MKKEIKIEGMSCQHCVKHVKDALEELGEVKVQVDLQAKTAVIESTSELQDEVIRTAIEDAGYDVEGIKAL